MVTKGGNKNFYDYLSLYKLESEFDLAKKYGSPAAIYYKDCLNKQVEGFLNNNAYNNQNIIIQNIPE